MYFKGMSMFHTTSDEGDCILPFVLFRNKKISFMHKKRERKGCFHQFHWFNHLPLIQVSLHLKINNYMNQLTFV